MYINKMLFLYLLWIYISSKFIIVTRKSAQLNSRKRKQGYIYQRVLYGRLKT